MLIRQLARVRVVGVEGWVRIAELLQALPVHPSDRPGDAVRRPAAAGERPVNAGMAPGHNS